MPVFFTFAMNADTSPLSSRVPFRPDYEILGAQLAARPGSAGARFSVRAPQAQSVYVTGDFNDWANPGQVLTQNPGSGIWSGAVAQAVQGDAYQFRIQSRLHSQPLLKADPYAIYAQAAPGTASRLWTLDYAWQDQDWMRMRGAQQALDRPICVYEVHLGSWRRDPQAPQDVLSYRDMAPLLAAYVQEMGFTHIEFMPVMEHPVETSWGYQTWAYFAPSARHGTPQDFMYLIDHLHQAGIGVLLDWTAAWFPCAAHGLMQFDGTALYEIHGAQRGFNPEAKNCLFDYSRPAARDFLLSSALFWLDKYHIDGLRMPAVASMLYPIEGRNGGENENTPAIDFLRALNRTLKTQFPGTLCIAEAATAWPGITRHVENGGLGFDMKWNAGWTHDSLMYFGRDPIYRSHHQDQLTLSIQHAFSENFMVSLPHDEVVRGKASLLSKMPGDAWQKFANLRLLLGYMWMHPGKKLLFMGGEFGQSAEWNHDDSLDWHLLEYQEHRGVQRWVQDLNRCYRSQASLYEADFSPQGFSWIDQQDHQHSVISFLRLSPRGAPPVLVICNCTPVPRHNYRVGIPRGGVWKEILNSDALLYGGSGQGNLGAVEAAPVAAHGHFHSLALTLPPLGVIAFTPQTARELP